MVAFAFAITYRVVFIINRVQVGGLEHWIGRSFRNFSHKLQFYRRVIDAKIKKREVKTCDKIITSKTFH